MNEPERYSIVYTYSAEKDIEEKAEYIEKALHSSRTAYLWYQRLRQEINNELAYYPEKYQIYERDLWRNREVREFISKNNIVFYSVDKVNHQVVIHAVFTAGKNITDDIIPTATD